MEKIANLLGVSTGFFPHISAIICFVVDGVTKLVFVSVGVEADGSPALCFHLPSLHLLHEEQSFKLLFNR